MYRFTLIAVGRVKNTALASLCADFAKRINRHGKFEQLELKDSDVETEGKRIIEALSKYRDARVYVLAEEGTCRNSVAFAGEIAELLGRPAIFIIGGAYGLSDLVKARADVLFALSPLTFTHEIARMLLYEQLYRALSINAGSSYHHA